MGSSPHHLIQLVDAIAEGSYVPICAVMAELPRFHLFEPSELDELLFSHRAEGTKRVIKSSGDIFQEFLTVKGLTLEDLQYSNATLDNTVNCKGVFPYCQAQRWREI